MSNGFLTIVLHCHLPYVRHPEHEGFLEEDWFYEAVAETYLPLLRVLRRLRRDDAPARIAVSLSPTLCEMISNELLRARCLSYLDQHVELAEREVRRNRNTPYAPAARMYRERYRLARRDYVDGYGPDLLSAFQELEDDGMVELMASAATHALLPLLQGRAAKRAQITLGLRNFEKHFGRRPAGFWLPECAYEPGLEQLLADAGVRYFCLDTHGLLLAEPRPPMGVFAPLKTPAGPFAFGRDVESSHQVWSADEGYPGDAAYREFHRDLGFDADLHYIAPYLHSDDVRRHLGFKYHRVTGDVPLAQKKPYDPQAGRRRAAEHAADFVRQKTRQMLRARAAIGRAPLILAPYDAELFGHWWLEGIDFLEDVLRGAAEQGAFDCVSPSQYLDALSEGDAPQEGRPALSSWGYGGYFDAWVNGSNDWLYPDLHLAESRMAQAAFRALAPDHLAGRALDQAARELLLAQASDWGFLISAGTARHYASRRFSSLMERFSALLDQVEAGRVDVAFLNWCESHDDAFPEVDHRVFRSSALLAT
ncbi:MAG: DUF1957 domain-containing protein [Planctomycetes bacterium]|nr:DUF1957 domain-containing protein [Planctomycetota bacterium]